MKAIDAGVYTDFSGLARLRADAQAGTPEALAETAQQFEALFIHMLLESMRATTGGDPLLGRSGALYTDLFDRQVSLELARKKGGVGLADMLVRQLSGASLPASSGADRALAGTPQALVGEPEAEAGGEAGEPAAPAPPRRAQASEPAWTSPDAFVRALLPHARAAGEALGVAPEALIAQAALETGWGRAVIRHPDGRNSHNVFAVKATPEWGGARVEVQTLEFADGVLVRERAPFRAYGSLAESFADYVELVSTRPRYRAALAAPDAAGYLRALAEGGYATDPDYAEKVIALATHDVPERLKDAGLGSL